MPESGTSQEIERELTPVERFFTRSPFAIVTMIARIKGFVSHDMLRLAVTKAQVRHPFLRVRIVDKSDHSQWFTSAGVQDIPIETLSRISNDDWNKVHTHALKIPYEFESRPAIRFFLVQSRAVSELIIMCHHIICDGMSLAYLARDLMVYLGDLERPTDMLPAAPPIDLHNLPADVTQSAIVKFLIARMNRQWAEERVFFDNEDYRVLTEAYWDRYTHAIISIELTEAQTSALVAGCRKEGITVNSALTAAFCGAQRFVEGEQPYQSDIVVAASLRDRIPNSPGEGMGMYAGGVELKFKYNPTSSFWENARRFHKTNQPKYSNKYLFADVLNWLYLDPTIFEALNFKKLGGLVPPSSARYEKLSAFSRRKDVVSRLLRRDNLESLDEKHWGAAVTNLGRLDFPKTYGGLELEHLIFQPGGGIPLANANLVLGAVTCSGKLSLVVEYAQEAVDPELMLRIRDKAMDLLKGE